MKYAECSFDNTKKFTVGKLYEVQEGANNHNNKLVDDTGRTRFVSVTHGGNGLRWNVGGHKHAAFGIKKPIAEFSGSGFVLRDGAGNVRVKMGSLDESKKNDRAELFARIWCGVFIVSLVAYGLYTYFA